MTTLSLPFVSICLLTYNRAEILPRSIESLLGQSHKDFELIINDDCSPDNTEAICREYERKDFRVRYHRNERNLRYAGNQNAALSRASSDFVAIVHDGDIYLPRLIESWVRALVNYPTAALVFNTVNALDAQGKVVRTYTHSYPPLVNGRELCREMLCQLGSPIFGIVMVRKKCVESAGPFDTSLPYLADVDMWLRLLLRYDAAYISEPIFSAAPREKGHANTGVNWRILDELERIHATNLRRAQAIPSTKAQEMEGAISRMLWKQRVQSLAWCIRHAELAKLWDGIKFVLKKPVLSQTSFWLHQS